MDEFPEGATLTHGAEPLFWGVDACGHPEPPPPGDSEEFSAWLDNHPRSGLFGDRFCLLSPAGTFCPACTQAEREERDLPMDEYVTCRR